MKKIIITITLVLTSFVIAAAQSTNHDYKGFITQNVHPALK